MVPGSAGFFFGGAKPFELTYRTSALTDVNQASYSFSGLSIGAPSGDRLVIAFCYTFSGSAISSVTIGGVSASTAATQSSGQVRSGLYYATVPSGTTATVAFSVGSGANAGVSVWTITGAQSSTPRDTGVATGIGSSTTIDVPAGGAILAGVGINRTGGIGSNTWSGLTERYDSPGFDTNLSNFSAASDVFATTQAARIVSVTHSASPTEQALAVASWR